MLHRKLVLSFLVATLSFFAEASSTSIGSPQSKSAGNPGGVETTYFNAQRVFSVSGSRGWTTVSLSPYGIPREAHTILARFQGRTHQWALGIAVRPNASEPEMTPFTIGAYGEGDDLESAVMIEIPVSNGSFQYRVSYGGGSQYALLDVIGFKTGGITDY